METIEQKCWFMVIGDYEGVEKRAVNLINGIFAGHVSYVLPVKKASQISKETLANYNIIAVGTVENNSFLNELSKKGCLSIPNTAESYSIYVGNSLETESGQVIAIAGKDASGVLYGCIEFYNRYFGEILCMNVNRRGEKSFSHLFDRSIPEWKFTSSPAIKTRAIWTWGHVIYDYRKFFENMALLRLNEIVIWNDIVPFNARDLVEYAHSCGIKVVFGYAWGWDQNCNSVATGFDAEALENIKQKAISVYETQYAGTGCDGIYFQSFTELRVPDVDGKSIADMVTDLVNETAGVLLEKYPKLHIQFGLHATSVKERLEIIKRTDKRIYIVWEDCGTFPYTNGRPYIGDTTKADFEEGLIFTEKMVKLRGEDEKFGAVYKALVNLDWKAFKHFHETYILGERTQSFIDEYKVERIKMWKTIMGYWIRELDKAIAVNGIIAKKNKNAIIQALVEDGVFEDGIMYPVALYAETLWNVDEDPNVVCDRVSKYPFVKFPNI